MRSVLKKIRSQATTEGAGVPIRRVFPTAQLDDLDPFLLLDHMGPNKMAAGQATGFPDHPHRGFETVTYLLDGQMEHRDSFGNRGVINPGGIQWMTAGSGLVHSELPGPDMLRTGGTLHGFQLWVNLPRKDKMAPPRYQELDAQHIPAFKEGESTIRVVAGEGGSVESRTPILYSHITLAPGASHEHAVPKNWNVFAYYFGGAREGDVELFAKDGDSVVLNNPSDKPSEVLLIGGEPIGEPVARYGPFVMNSKEELYKAFEDFRAGKMGQIA